jgi:hypothetical protein
LKIVESDENVLKAPRCGTPSIEYTTDGK